VRFKQPTIKDVLATINAMSNMVCWYTPEYKEFRVRYIGRPEADYFTQDKLDALKTAEYMRRWGGEWGKSTN